MNLMKNGEAFVVGVFGTWRAPEDSLLYRQAWDVGRVAATAGGTVLTGAYSGIMEAAVRGAKEAGGKTLGYSWKELDAELSPNGYLDSLECFDSAAARLARLMEDSDVCVFFPGRTGTVAELALAVELRSKGRKRSPLVLWGDHWHCFFDFLHRANGNLDFPSDVSAPELYVTIHNPEGLRRYLDRYEYSRN